MFIIAGLGNPTKEYDGTRHNIGFRFIDELADEYNIGVTTIQYKALVGKGIIEGQKVLLVKPLTFMNLSGESIRELTDYYKIDPSRELIVISDDIELPPGFIRVRPHGSSGGHNGLKNIIKNIGTEDFQRIRVGVGQKPPRMELADYVLGHFKPDEREQMDEGLKKAAGALKLMLEDRTDEAMNAYNQKVPKKKKEEDGTEQAQ
ncbi:MAG: aminoacyl-tRNA hydrolase [Lachnospiraceae bacterium]|nr:aminoacyl-tRNA hydrolase [Lachnospiraceae bacterium]